MINSFKKILLIISCTFMLFANASVDAANIESAETLKETFEGENATISGKNITLTGNIESNDVLEIGGDDYVLDLNGYKLTAGEIYINDGSLTINDTKSNGEIDTTGDWFWVEDGANLTINNGKIDYLVNGGNTIINNANIENLTNDGTMTIKNGNFTYFWSRGVALTINGGTFGPTTIELDKGKITISGNVEFKRVEETGTPLTLYSGTLIDKEAINQILGEGFISTTNEYGTNRWEDELYESGWCYEVTYGKTYVMADETEEIFNKIAPNGVWTINGSKPKNMEESEFLLTSMADDIKVDSKYKVYAYADFSGDSFNPEKVSMFLEYAGCSGCTLKEKKVTAVYNEPSKEIKISVNSVLSKISNKIGDNLTEENGFILEDLYLINYLNASTKGMDSSLALNFSKDLIELTNGGNISYKYDSRLGSFTPTELWGFTGGNVIVYYNGIAVGTTRIGLTTSNVLYVPSNTANTDEARIAAALKRIKDYLGTTKGITITVGGTLESLNNDGATWKDYGFVDDKTSGTNYYNVTINGETYKFAICMKEEKDLETPEYLASDILSNISIKSSSTELPLDTAITVKEVTNKDIAKALGTNLYAAYDISLYSNAKQVKITKLENGKFIVSIPVPEKLEGKSLTVYYINSKGEKEEHFATLSEDGKSLTFETNHFSTYVLAEKTIENPVIPETLDAIGNYVFMFSVSLVVIVLTKKYLKNRNN